MQLWGVESMGLGFKGAKTREFGFGFEFEFFFFICFFPRKVYREDEKVQKEKKINDIEVLCIYLLVLFSLGHVVVLMAINLYFILSVSHVSIFHSSLNGNDHFNIISKG